MAEATLQPETLFPPGRRSCWQGQARCEDTLETDGEPCLCPLSSLGSLLKTVIMKTFPTQVGRVCTPHR